MRKAQACLPDLTLPRMADSAAAATAAAVPYQIRLALRPYQSAGWCIEARRRARQREEGKGHRISGGVAVSLLTPEVRQGQRGEEHREERDLTHVYALSVSSLLGTSQPAWCLRSPSGSPTPAESHASATGSAEQLRPASSYTTSGGRTPLINLGGTPFIFENESLQRRWLMTMLIGQIGPK